MQSHYCGIAQEWTLPNLVNIIIHNKDHELHINFSYQKPEIHPKKMQSHKFGIAQEWTLPKIVTLRNNVEKCVEFTFNF